jgi:hypothetical protein
MHLNNISTVKGRTRTCNFDSAMFSGNRMSHKNDCPVVARNKVAAMRHFFNSDLQQITSF